MLRFVIPRQNTMKFVAAIALLFLGGVLVSCGKGTVPPQPIPSLAGPWEFIAISSNTALPWTGVEVALQEGQIVVNGFPQPDGNISASSAQMAFVSLGLKSQLIIATGFGGNCTPVTTDNSLGPATVTALAAPISFSFTQNGNLFNVTGTISSDGKSLLNGTYTAQAGNACTADTGGTITGNALSKLTGTYVGTMCPLASSSCTSQTDTATAVVSEGSGGALTLNLTISGTDDTAFSMTGSVTGNAFTAQGTYQGQTIIFDGYYQQSGPGLYLVNAASGSHVGTLVFQ